MKHELWIEEDESQTFCLAGPHGESARGLLGEIAKLIWSCEAESHFEAMQSYYAYMDWGEYKSDFPVQDKNLRGQSHCCPTNAEPVTISFAERYLFLASL